MSKNVSQKLLFYKVAKHFYEWRRTPAIPDRWLKAVTLFIGLGTYFNTFQRISTRLLLLFIRLASATEHKHHKRARQVFEFPLFPLSCLTSPDRCHNHCAISQAHVKHVLQLKRRPHREVPDEKLTDNWITTTMFLREFMRELNPENFQLRAMWEKTMENCKLKWADVCRAWLD